MNNITYGGVKYIKIRHAVYCKKCKDTIESKFIHDFKYCLCGAIGIDDNQIIGSILDIENRSIYRAIVNNKYIFISSDQHN
jgi:hypothetical protein